MVADPPQAVGRRSPTHRARNVPCCPSEGRGWWPAGAAPGATPPSMGPCRLTVPRAAAPAARPAAARSGPPPLEPPGQGRGQGGARTTATDWSLLGHLGARGRLVLVLLLMFIDSTTGKQISYTEFLTQVRTGRSRPSPGTTSTARSPAPSGQRRSSTPPAPAVPRCRPDDAARPRRSTSSSRRPSRPLWLGSLIPLLLPSSCSSASSSGCSAGPRARWATSCRSAESRAKTYTTERPATTFADVAGYEGVKLEINEVVDFLKYPERFGRSAPASPRACCSSALPAPARP